MNTMQYQITHFSPAGQAEKLATAFQAILPQNSPCCSLDANTSPEADVHLVGFDFSSTEPKNVPQQVRMFLNQLKGKTILLFATVPFQLNDVLEKRVSDIALAALPGECDYLGLYVCTSQPSDRLLQHLEDSMQRNPNNTRASYWHERSVQAVGHPNETDIRNACRFVAHVLRLDI